MLFLLTGPDTYQARQKLNELKAKFRREVDPTGLNLLTVQGAAIDESALSHYLATAPLLARRRFVVIEDFFRHASIELQRAMAELLPKDSEESTVIVFFESTPSKSPTTVYRWLLQHAYVQQFSPLEGRALTAWAEAACSELQRTIEPHALVERLAVTSNDLWRLSHEIAKLDAYLMPQEVIRAADVQTVVGEPLADNIFELVDTIVSGAVKRSAPLLLQHLAQGLSAQQLVALLEKQLRLLILLAEATGSRPPHLEGVHPYVVKKLWPVAHKAEVPRLKKIYADLAEVDVDLKRSAGDARTLLLAFLTKSFSARVS